VQQVGNKYCVRNTVARKMHNIKSSSLFSRTQLCGPREWQNVDLYEILDSDKFQNLVELALQTFSILEEFTHVNILQHEHE
jgi:hypothetical protein